MKRSLTIQLDQDVFETLIELAKHNHISVAGQIRMLLAQVLHNEPTECTDTSTRDKTN